MDKPKVIPSASAWLGRRLRIWARPLSWGGRLYWPLVAVFLVVNGLVAFNAALHDPRVGYDAQDHLKYVTTLAQGRLPGPQDSLQFFAPPLPYVVPALGWRLTGDIFVAGKLAQAVNALLALGLTWYLLQLGRLLGPRPALRLGLLAFLGVLPVYYKMFALVRGEPYVAFFTVLAAYQVLRLFARRPRPGHAVRLGVSLGLGGLSRQLGMLLLPAVGLWGAWRWLKARRWRRAVSTGVVLSLLVGGLLSGWFYGVLKARRGAATAFNLPRARHFSLRNHPTKFYLGPGLPELFTSPVRPAFTNQFVPIFYTEVWGDYWGYFAVAGQDTRSGEPVSGFRHIKKACREHRPVWLRTNYDVMPAYLGRVNRAGLYPTLLGLAAVAVAALAVRPRSRVVRSQRQRHRLAFVLLVLVVNLAGYAWFVVMHPTDGPGLRIRAGHLLQVYPLVAALVGYVLERVDRRARVWYGVLLIGLAAVFVHNMEAMVTHYPQCRRPAVRMSRVRLPGLEGRAREPGPGPGGEEETAE